MADHITRSSRNLVRFDHGDPRAAEAGRRGAAVVHARRRAEQAEIARRLEQVVEQHVDRIAEVFESVLALEPDPTWKDSTKLDFRTRQISQIEKLLNRVEGLPVARQRVVAERAEIDESIASLPAPVVERMLVALVTAGRGGDAVVLAGEVVCECDAWDGSAGASS
jgi:hypothetical protein